MIADTWTINPTTVLDIRLGFMRWDYDRTPGHTGIDIPATFGLPRIPYGEIASRNQVPNSTRDPSLQFSNTTYNTHRHGSDLRGGQHLHSDPHADQDCRVSHTLKFGGEIRRADINYFRTTRPGGTFTFNNSPTAAVGSQPLGKR